MRKQVLRNEKGFSAAKQTEALQSNTTKEGIVMNNITTTSHENHALVNIHQQNIGGSTVQTVNARELHTYLENGDHFTTWIKDRIKQYDFIQGVDFAIFSEFSEKGRPKNEYHITLDMAKELSMVERNEKGKQARRYFIECERQGKGSHEMWYSPMTKRVVSVPVTMKARPTANAILKQAGIDERV